jgi:putative ubiquitin-RnfH superfamily antitoxin RatB of RatAB toxin-antitoxin module
MVKKIKLTVCDARQEPLQLVSYELPLSEPLTVGAVLKALGIFDGPADPRINRKGMFGVFGKRKDWDSPFYDGDRLEIYSPLLINPMEARRKKANKNKDARLQAKAAGRKGRFLSRS